MQSLSSAPESTVQLIQFSVVSQETLQNTSVVLCSQQELGGGNTAEQPQNWFPNVSRKILHNPCRACAWSNKNLFRTIGKNIFSATKNWCLNPAGSWGLGWETEALGSPEHLTWGSAKVWLLNKNLNFPRAALKCRFSPAQTQKQSRALHIPPWH